MSRRPLYGFTAVEALFASAILAIITTAVAGALMAGRAQTKTARDTVTAAFLAKSLMDEIIRLPFNDPNGYSTMGPDPLETSRSLYCHVSAYYGYTDGTSNIADLAGNLYPSDYQTFVRSVSMQSISVTPSGWGRTITGLLITVSVSRDGNQVINLQRIAWD